MIAQRVGSEIKVHPADQAANREETMARVNFTGAQRTSALAANARWLKDHKVDGIEMIVSLEQLRQAGVVYYCENCLFCHTNVQYFDVDHVVADSLLLAWGRQSRSGMPENMAVLCKSVSKGDFGCNQTKSARIYVPVGRGLAFSHPELDMNCVPIADRPFTWAKND